MKFVATFGERLKAYREEHGLSLRDIEKMTGYSATALNRYELGLRHPKMETVVRCAEAFHVDVLWLCGISDEDSVDNRITERLSELSSSQKEQILDYIHYIGHKNNVQE